MPKADLVKKLDHIHTPDSWARSVLQAAVKAESEQHPLPGFTVLEGPECVTVCYDSPIGRICVCL